MTTFSITVTMRTKNADLLPKLQARLSDFSAPLENIIREWAKGNSRKFALARGAETTGAQHKGGPYWEPLRAGDVNSYLSGGSRGESRYQRWKRRQGFANWLMVATGSLMRSLTTPGGFGQYVDAKRAVFGTPLDTEDADKALYNRETRRVIFLGRGDRNMIKREIKRYLDFGEGYRQVFADASADRYARDLETAQSRIDIGTALGVPAYQVEPI